MLRCVIFCVGVATLAADAGAAAVISSLPEGVTLHNVLAPWAAAQAHCATEGAIIASPINESIYKAMKSLIDVRNTTFYIGARATAASPGRFVSLEGVPLEDMTVAMINMSPQLDPLLGDCVAMNSDNMRVVPCWTRLPYMCFRNVSHATTTTSTPQPDSIKSIDDEGYTYQPSTRQYYKVHREEMKWSDASLKCEEEGAQLAIIHSEEEAKLIRNMYDFSDDNWLLIGLKLHTDPSRWQTINGQPITSLYNEWVVGATPLNTNLACGALHKNGKLDDMYCSSARAFICQKELTTV